MAQDPDAQSFIGASLLERAVLLLTRAFRDPPESVSRVNVANGNASGAGAVSGSFIGGTVVGATGGRDPRILLLVSEAWQVLESARFVCRDLTQPEGDWWLLTSAGRYAEVVP